MIRLSCVNQTFRAFMSRLPCVFCVSRLCKFERTTTPSCVHLRLDISVFRLGPQPWNALTSVAQRRFYFNFWKGSLLKAVTNWKQVQVLGPTKKKLAVNSKTQIVVHKHLRERLMQLDYIAEVMNLWVANAILKDIFPQNLLSFLK